MLRPYAKSPRIGRSAQEGVRFDRRRKPSAEGLRFVRFYYPGFTDLMIAMFTYIWIIFGDGCGQKYYFLHSALAFRRVEFQFQYRSGHVLQLPEVVLLYHSALVPGQPPS